MARRSDYRSFYELIAILVTIAVIILTFVFRFLREVYRLNLWSELFKSLLAVLVGSCVVAGMAQASMEVAVVVGLAGIIYFCWWWHKKFSYADTRLNSSSWQQQAWWWTLDGWQFEQEVAKVFITQGYKAHVTKGSGDGGVDIILKHGDYTAIVQCKHYQNPVPPEPIRALWGCKDDFNADEVIMVASSGLTAAGYEFVRNKPNYRVMNLDDIIRMSQCTLQQEAQKLSQPKIAEPESSQPKIAQQTHIHKKRVSIGRKIDF